MTDKPAPGWGPFNPHYDLIGSLERSRSEEEIRAIVEAPDDVPEESDAAPEEAT